MDTEKRIISRIRDLIAQGENLRIGSLDNEMAIDGTHKQNCEGWVVAACNIVQFLIENPDSLYRKHVESIASNEHNWQIVQAVGQITELLKNLLIDFENGFLLSVVNQARAEVFDDFLDHSRAYLEEGRKNEAGVISGVVFEDTLRRICKNNKIEEAGKNIDSLISALSRAGIITGIMAKRARVGAHVRTKATHAQWDEFDIDDVKATIASQMSLFLKSSLHSHFIF